MRVCILAVPYDSGHRDERMGAGPLALLPELEARLAQAGHQVRHEIVELPPDVFPIEVPAAFELNRELSRRVRRAADDGEAPLVLSGNCNGAVGALAGIGTARLGLAWFDAHGDINTPETTDSGYLDGMGLAIVIGRCWRRLAASVPGYQPLDEDRVLLLGVRDLDPEEAKLVASSKVRALSPDQVRENLSALLADLAPRVDGIYVHLDLDVLDPSEGIANQLPVADGLSVDEIERAVVGIKRQIPIRGVGLGSYDPRCDRDGRVAIAAVRLFVAAFELRSLSAVSRQAPTIF